MEILFLRVIVLSGERVNHKLSNNNITVLTSQQVAVTIYVQCALKSTAIRYKPSVSKLSLTFLHSRNLDSYEPFPSISSVGCENFTVAPVLQRRLFRGILLIISVQILPPRCSRDIVML